MNRFWRGTALGLFFASTGIIQAVDDPPKKDDPPAKKDDKAQTPAEKFAAAKKTSDEANKAYGKVISELQKKKESISLENKEFNEVYQARTKAIQDLVKAAEELAKSEPTTPAGFDAIVTVINNGFGPPPAMVLKLLTEHHVENPKINQIVGRFYYSQDTSELAAFLNKVIEKNSSRDIQANAMLILARTKMNKSPEEATKLLETVLEKYKDIPNFETAIAKRVNSNLFEMRNLQIGKVVPDIEGEDVDGKKFKLSDYRGKVVMLDFWGHW